MTDSNPIKVRGAWKEGYALDLHVRSSEFMGYDDHGHPQFDTERTDLGELLYRVKYQNDRDALAPLVSASKQFLEEWKPPIDVIVPVPPSRQRARQPVVDFATELAKSVGLPLLDVVRRTRTMKQLKNITDHDERSALLANAHKVITPGVRGKQVLLVDDLIRSGATLNAVTRALVADGQALAVYVLAITRTRRKP